MVHVHCSGHSVVMVIKHGRRRINVKTAIISDDICNKNMYFTGFIMSPKLILKVSRGTCKDNFARRLSVLYDSQILLSKAVEGNTCVLRLSSIVFLQVTAKHLFYIVILHYINIVEVPYRIIRDSLPAGFISLLTYETNRFSLVKSGIGRIGNILRSRGVR